MKHTHKQKEYKYNESCQKCTQLIEGMNFERHFVFIVLIVYLFVCIFSFYLGQIRKIERNKNLFRNENSFSFRLHVDRVAPLHS